MAEKMKENIVDERVRAAKITDEDTGMVYTLDFNRESVVFAERNGFEIEAVGKFPASTIPELFYYAFRMHHGPKKGNISRGQTDAILERLKGVSPEFLERLILLYSQAAYSNNVVETTEEMGKNGHMTVEL